jgi:hypothetical protein
LFSYNCFFFCRNETNQMGTWSWTYL